MLSSGRAGIAINRIVEGRTDAAALRVPRDDLEGGGITPARKDEVLAATGQQQRYGRDEETGGSDCGHKALRLHYGVRVRATRQY